MSFTIQSRTEYRFVMIEILKMIDRGEENLSLAERRQLGEMMVAAEKYEEAEMVAGGDCPGW
ncbi:hypothetical protein [Chitinophaga deserti]|uniref:hypothetical protein n=1 Tax=Chitinophaga deserti TaxID=2164099 RepID=UPI000D6C7608|nr:hypothetical protein [Chitinophaga deserti]